ncbi:hypothetical protein [uncultured Holdemanella sp.]|jgi:hypothetical protein|uniref:hypothetical protein n=1 Tax=uncultured Holdemanella sp. TaxID=1763549 RepID=UPI0025EF53E5|nr:hypothetical protein [uncultured Holdemanella sp.]
MISYIFWLIPIIYSVVCLFKKKLFGIFYMSVILDVALSLFLFHKFNVYVSVLIYCAGFALSYYRLDKEDVIYLAYDYNQLFLRFGLMIILSIVMYFERLFLGFAIHIVYPIVIFCIMSYFNKKAKWKDEDDMFHTYYFPIIAKYEKEQSIVFSSLISRLSNDQKKTFITNYEKEHGMDLAFMIEYKKLIVGTLAIVFSTMLIIIIIGG